MLSLQPSYARLRQATTNVRRELAQELSILRPEPAQQAAAPAAAAAPASLWSRLTEFTRQAAGTLVRGIRGLFTSAPSAEPAGGGAATTLRRGAQGAEVRDLQNRLKAAGFDPGPIDGSFGPLTEACVRLFQKRKGLTVDGIVGPQTWGALGVKGSSPSSGAPATGKAAAVIAQAKRFEGQRYVWGGGHSGRTTGVGGVDCSGLIQQAYRLAGLGSGLDGTAATQQTKGTKVSMNDLKPGDLLFHGTPASHVGLYIGNGKAIHASSTYGRVMIVDVKQYGYFDNARRVL